MTDQPPDLSTEEQRKRDIRAFQQFCDRVGKRAAKRGLTEAKLAEILEEIRLERLRDATRS